MRHFQVRNWSKFQHYKNRNPPWIKLHTELLENYEFASLQDASKLLAMCIWMLAARSDNKIPADPDWIKSKCNLKSKPDLSPLFDAGFIEWIQELPSLEQDASKALADCEQSADSEERRDRGEGEGASASKPKPSKPSKRCPPDFIVTEELKTWAAEACPGVDIEKQTAAFRDHQFKDAHTDWEATWRNWIRRASTFGQQRANTPAAPRARAFGT